MAQEQLDLWSNVETPKINFCVKDLDDLGKCQTIFRGVKPNQLQCVKNLVSNGWRQGKALVDAGYNTKSRSLLSGGPDECVRGGYRKNFPIEFRIIETLAKCDPENGWWIKELLEAPPRTTLRMLLYTYQKLLHPDESSSELFRLAGIDRPDNDHSAARLESSRGVQFLLTKKRAEMENLQATFEWKVKKLVELVELCTPSNAENHKDTNPGSTISAISELNKMQGHYAPDRSVNANMNIESDPAIECVRETMEEIFLQWERDF